MSIEGPNGVQGAVTIDESVGQVELTISLSPANFTTTQSVSVVTVESTNSATGEFPENNVVEILGGA